MLLKFLKKKSLIFIIINEPHYMNIIFIRVYASFKNNFSIKYLRVLNPFLCFQCYSSAHIFAGYYSLLIYELAILKLVEPLSLRSSLRFVA